MKEKNNNNQIPNNSGTFDTHFVIIECRCVIVLDFTVIAFNYYWSQAMEPTGTKYTSSVRYNSNKLHILEAKRNAKQILNLKIIVKLK